MTPVRIFALPHNGRSGLYPGDVDEDGVPYSYPAVHHETYLRLPIEMPRSVMMTFGRDRDEVLAIDVLGEGGGRIRREDVAQVWRGICQFNEDCRERDALEQEE